MASALVFRLNPTKYSTYVMHQWWTVGYISMLLFILNWVLIVIFGYFTFRAKKLNQSANEQSRIQNLNKLYQLRDKAAEEDDKPPNLIPKLSMHMSLKDTANKPMSKKKSIGNNLQTPLLSTTTVTYSDNEEAVKMKIINNNNNNDNNGLLDSMENDNVASMLASLSEDKMDDMDNNTKDGVIQDSMGDMINWDKVQGRGNRGMSDITKIHSSNKMQVNDTTAFSQKRKVKRSSFDGNISKSTSSTNLINNSKGDDIV